MSTTKWPFADMHTAIRQATMIDVSDNEDVVYLSSLILLYEYMIDFLMDVNKLQQHPDLRVIEWLGPDEEIDATTEALEDKIETLQLATSAEVRAAIAELIAEARLP